MASGLPRPKIIKVIKNILININYSSTNYEAITRQNALEKLVAFQLLNKEVII
jgi:aminopeptidase N